MSFINVTNYFNNSDINVPGVQLETSGNFDTAIIQYEPEILKKLLGYELYTLLIADLDESGDPQSQIYTDLVDGAEFSFDLNGRTVNTKWNGLRNDEYISLIAYYVYFNERSQNENFYSNYGQVQSLGENSTKVDVTPKLINVWNKMIDLYGVTPNYIFQNLRSPVEYYLEQGNYRHYNALPSAYNFLLANIDDYPTWVFEPLEYKNIYGI